MKVDGKKLASLRESKHLSRDELAGLADLSLSGLQRIEDEGVTSVRGSTIRKLATGLALAPGELVPMITPNGSGPPAGVEPADLPPTVPEWEVNIVAGRWVEIPVCALNPDDPRDKEIIERGIFRLRIVGDCMEPDYQSGQVVEFQLLRPDREGPQEGSDYVFCRSDGTGTFKRLVAVTEDAYQLAALNQRDYPGIILLPKQELARVAKVMHRLIGPPDPKIPKIKGGL